MTVLTSILQSIRSAASYNKHELAAPRVILWPDEERLWMQCIEPMRASYPALWSLGDYAPGKATGPAAWLRYQLETQSGEDVPVSYRQVPQGRSLVIAETLLLRSIRIGEGCRERIDPFWIYGFRAHGGSVFSSRK
jgi:hypothetical protein